MNLRRAAKSLRHLWRTSPPWPVYATLVATRMRAPGIRRRFRSRRAAFEAMARDHDFSTDWFMSRLCDWLAVFDRHPMPASPEILEIGSWEGMSALFMLSNWPGARLTCVDTWQGGPAHPESGKAASEIRFNANTARYSGRVTKFRGTSAAFFAASSVSERFDLVYIDGSHRYADVLGDAFAGFDALKPGGIMIFDDYLMSPYDGKADGPAPAINRLLADRRGRYELVAVNWQLVLRKLPGGDPR